VAKVGRARLKDDGKGQEMARGINEHATVGEPADLPSDAADCFRQPSMCGELWVSSFWNQPLAQNLNLAVLY
jgi:hypothetical protein